VVRQDKVSDPGAYSKKTMTYSDSHWVVAFLCHNITGENAEHTVVVCVDHVCKCSVTNKRDPRCSDTTEVMKQFFTSRRLLLLVSQNMHLKRFFYRISLIHGIFESLSTYYYRVNALVVNSVPVCDPCRHWCLQNLKRSRPDLCRRPCSVSMHPEVRTLME